jgi:serine phosphatase RsbU (regulator of sigma subunit)
MYQGKALPRRCMERLPPSSSDRGPFDAGTHRSASAWPVFCSRSVMISNSGLPYPIRCSGDECGQIELPGVPLGSFPSVVYDEIALPLRRGDVFVFCTDGIFETASEQGEDLGTRRVCEIVRSHREGTAREIVDAIFDQVGEFRGHAPQHDDMTAVAVKITT